MIIKRLGIKAFGKLRECEFHLSDGINVIYGENEAGKTTFQWFIKAMFYGLEGGRARKEEAKAPIKRFKPWEGSQYGGFMEYTLDDGSSYMVNRDFNRNIVRILDSSFNDITHFFKIGKDRKIKFAEEHLGLNETCFEKTVFVKQMEIRIDSKGKQEIVDRLINAQETGYEDVSFKSAEKALTDAIKTYAGTDKSTARPLDKIAARLGRLNEMLEDFKSKREKFHEIEACISETKVKMINNKRETDILNITGELLKTARKLCRLKEIKENSREMAERLTGLKNMKRNLGAGIAAAYFAAAAMAIIERYVLASVLRLPAAAHVILMLILAFAVPGVLLLVRRGTNKSQEELEKKIDKMSNPIIDNRINNLGSQFIGADKKATGANNIKRKQESIKNDIENTKAKLFSLVERLEKEGELKFPWVFSLMAEGNEDSNWPGDVVDIDSILDKEEKAWIIACENAMNEEMKLALELKEYETLINSMDYDDDKVQMLVEEIEELEIKKKNLEGIRYSLNKALEVLQESRLVMQRDFMPLLNERMSYYLGRITSGKYKDIRADDRLIIKAMGSESVDIVSLPQLSSGTIDQVYIALRLALVDLTASRREKLPLIMDEIFSQFDDTRTRETLKILDELSGDRQIIIFTCKKREVDMLSEICKKAKVIELTGT